QQVVCLPACFKDRGMHRPTARLCSSWPDLGIIDALQRLLGTEDQASHIPRDMLKALCPAEQITIRGQPAMNRGGPPHHQQHSLDPLWGYLLLDSLLRIFALRLFEGNNFPSRVEYVAIGARDAGAPLVQERDALAWLDHHPWRSAVTWKRESPDKRTRSTDTARRPHTRDAGVPPGRFPATPPPCRLARDRWPLRTSLERAENVFASTARAPLGWERRRSAPEPSSPRGGR